jgi:hypothetical protein
MMSCSLGLSYYYRNSTCLFLRKCNDHVVSCILWCVLSKEKLIGKIAGKERIPGEGLYEERTHKATEGRSVILRNFYNP